MAQPPSQQPDEYRRWLEALAKAMGSAHPSSPPADDPNPPKAAGLLGFASAGRQPPASDFPHMPPKGMGSEQDFPPVGSERTTSLDVPRVWDLCKPYLLFVAVVLLGGLSAIGGLVLLTQWLVPPTRPVAPSAPIEAQWDVRRRGLHILPEDQTAPRQVSEPSAEEAPLEQTAPDQADSDRTASDPSASEKPISEKPFSETP